MKKKRLLWGEALEIQGGWDLERFFFLVLYFIAKIFAHFAF